MDDGAPASGSPSFCLQNAQCAVDPAGCRSLVVEVAFDALGDPRPTERGEAFVEQPAGLAELRVGTVAQRQHRVAHVRRDAAHRRPSARRRSRSRAAADRPRPRCWRSPAGSAAPATCAGVASAMSSTRAAKPSLPAALRAASASASALPDSVANRMVSGAAACRRSGGGGLRRGGRLIAGEEATQPGSLLGAAPGDDAVQRDDLFGREGRGFRQHDVLSPATIGCVPGARAAAAARRPVRRRSVSAHALGIAAAICSASASVVMPDTLAWRGRLGDEGDRLERRRARPRAGAPRSRRSGAAPCRARARRRRAPVQPSR